jgi:hypothetical protein
MLNARKLGLLVVALVLVLSATQAQAACFGRTCNVLWAPGAQKTPVGGISRGAHLTPFGVTSGHQTAYGVTSGHQTAFGVTSGKQTSFGVVGAGCRRTAFGYVCSSDIRLKRDIEPIGQLANGLDLYRYRYLWSDQLYVGVMAQEVAAIEPAAVMRGADGYLRVNYARLGLRLQTWQEWQATH